MEVITPIVSVIVPVYNTDKYLEECLESILNQTLKDIEIICIEDKSADNSLQILKEFSKKDDRIIIIENDENRGISFNRNKGMAYAKGKYISFIDSDDKLDKDAYEKLYNFIEENHQDFVIFNTLRFNDDGEIWNSELHKISISDKPIKSTKILNNREFIFDTTAWNKFINKDFLLNSKIKFKEGKLYEDMIFSMELFCASDSVGVLPDVYYYWRVRTDNENKSITQSYDNVENIKNRLFIINEINDLFNNKEYSSLMDNFYKKLLKIDYRHIINQLNSNYEIINLVEKYVKPKIMKMDKSLFQDLNDNLKLKYDILINGDIENIIYLRKFEIDVNNQITVLKKNNVAVKNENNILKEETSLIYEKNYELKESNKKLKKSNNDLKKTNKKLKKTNKDIKKSNNDLKKTNKKLKKTNKDIKKTNKKLKNEIKVIKSTKGWFNYKIRNILDRIFKN